MTTLKFTNEIIITEDEKTARNLLRRLKIKIGQVTIEGNSWEINVEYKEPKSNKKTATDPDAARIEAGW